MCKGGVQTNRQIGIYRNRDSVLQTENSSAGHSMLTSVACLDFADTLHVRRMDDGNIILSIEL